jgi:hypothetical protein
MSVDESGIILATGHSPMPGLCFVSGAWTFSICHHIQTGSGPHPVGTGGHFPGAKAGKA